MFSPIPDIMKLRILLVEDDVMVGPVVREMLCNAGYEVVLKRDLADIRILGDFNYSAIISDFKLLASDGGEVIAFVRNKSPGIPAMLISGYGNKVANLCAKRGIENVLFLGKPFSPKQLLEALHAMISTGAERPLLRAVETSALQTHHTNQA
jgi:DNA-binding response OmpR family regulator